MHSPQEAANDDTVQCFVNSKTCFNTLATHKAVAFRNKQKKKNPKLMECNFKIESMGLDVRCISSQTS